MDHSQKKMFFDRLKYGRVFLFLGFDYFKEIFGFNPVMQIISDSNMDGFKFEDIYSLNERINNESTFNRLQKDISSLPTNNTLDPISYVRWNSIYTSSVDDLILSRLKDESRVTMPICRHDKKLPYSRTELGIHYLFGLYSRRDPAEKVPENKKEFLKRCNEASLMLNDLVDSMTPLDTLIISGWNPKTDPLKPDIAYQILSKLSQNQIYTFGYSNELDEDELIIDLALDNILSITKESLPSFILNEKESFKQLLNTNSDLDSFIRVNDKAVEIPSRVRRLVNHFGQIVEDKFFAQRYDDKEHLYREFLFESSRTPVWEAYVNKLDFERDYYSKLYTLVTDEIKRSKVLESPIILHGSTGTGKSISIARLCYDLYHTEKYLVLHIGNQRDGLDFKIIDEICEWAESSEDLTTVICWDGMSEVDTYQNLSSYLSGRGRKQVVIGTTYKIIGKTSKLYIESHEQFSKTENDRFIKYLTDNKIPVEYENQDFNSTFLVALYWLLPETRYAITSGVVNEANRIKSRFHQKITVTNSCENVIAEAFRIALEKNKLEINSYITNNVDSGIPDIIDTVMIFGKYGIETPFDVLMRVYPSLKMSNIGQLFKQVDIVRWTENTYGEIHLSARNTLEANIYCSRIIANKRELIRKLITVINSIEQKRLHSCPEIKFCIDIVRAFGPNGADGKEYSDFYLDISRSIGTLLSKKNIVSSRLMLLQANLLREFGRVKFDNKDTYYQEYYDLLTEAKEVIENAIDIEQRNEQNSARSSNSSLITLYGEKASILGTLANQIQNNNGPEQIVTGYISEAISTLKESFKYKISNYISLDSIAWIAMNYTKGVSKLNAEQLKFLLDAIALFDEYTVDDIEDRYQVDFLQRKASLYKKIGTDDFCNDALDDLKSLSPEDYHYYSITKIINGVSFETADNNNISVAKEVILYIKRHKLQEINSYKINVIYLRMYWFYENHVSLLKGERVVIKKNESFWEHVFAACDNIIKNSYNNNVIRYHFIQAISLFNLSDFSNCDKIFKYLSRESESISGSKRIFKSFLMSNENGVRKFSGEITRLQLSRNRGEIYIDELKTKVMFLPSDFNITLGDEGGYINDFHIAFNYLGPLADNVKYFKAGN